MRSRPFRLAIDTSHRCPRAGCLRLSALRCSDEFKPGCERKPDLEHPEMLIPSTEARTTVPCHPLKVPQGQSFLDALPVDRIQAAH